MSVPIVQVLSNVVLFFDLKGVGQLLPLPFHNLYSAGFLGSSISLCIIMGFFPHDLSCIQYFCWFVAMSPSATSFAVCCFLACVFAVNDACLLSLGQA